MQPSDASTLLSQDTSSQELSHKMNEQFMNSRELDSIIENVIDNFHIPGIQIGLIVDGEVVLSRGYGCRNLTEKKPMTEDTVVGIGSASKAFATYILWQLVEEGTISWDDPVTKYIPEFCLSDPDSTQKITILDLAAHRTGIFRHDALWYLSKQSKLSPLDGLKLLPFLGAESKPRETFQYNNFMYSVLGLIIERVTGTSYEEAVSIRILKPLEMNHSGFSHEAFNRSFPYAYIEGIIQEISFQKTPAISVGGGIYSTVSDMLKWIELHLKNQSSMEKMYTVQMPFSVLSEGDIRSLGYGCGWFVGEYRGFKHIYHGGLVDGFAAHVAFLPQKNTGLVILTNSSSDGLTAINFLEQTIFDKIFRLDLKHQFPKKQPSMNEKNVVETFPSHSLQDYVGDYTHPAYGLIQVRVLDDRLTLFYTQEPIPLKPSGDNLFTAKVSELQKFGISPWVEVSFFTDSDGKISNVQIPFEAFRSGKPINFTRKSLHSTSFLQSSIYTPST